MKTLATKITIGIGIKLVWIKTDYHFVSKSHLKLILEKMRRS